MPSEARRHGEGMGRGRRETGDKERENRSSMGMPWKEEPKSTFLIAATLVNTHVC